MKRLRNKTFAVSLFMLLMFMNFMVSFATGEESANVISEIAEVTTENSDEGPLIGETGDAEEPTESPEEDQESTDTVNPEVPTDEPELGEGETPQGEDQESEDPTDPTVPVDEQEPGEGEDPPGEEQESENPTDPTAPVDEPELGEGEEPPGEEQESENPTVPTAPVDEPEPGEGEEPPGEGQEPTDPLNPEVPPVEPVEPVPGIPPGGGIPEIVPPSIIVPPPLGDVEVTITADRETAGVGEFIYYTITIMNKGEEPLLDIMVSDPMIGLEETITQLDPGLEQQFTGEYQVTLGDVGKIITNTVYATGEGINPQQVSVDVKIGELDPLDERIFVPDPSASEIDLSGYYSAAKTLMLMGMRGETLPELSVNKTAETFGELCERIFKVNLTITGRPKTMPIDVILVIDESGSMGYRIPGDSKTPMQYAKIAAAAFAQTVLQADTNNRVGVISFSGPTFFWGDSSDARNEIDLTSNQNQVINRISNLSASGGTNIQSAYELAEARMNAKGRNNAIKAVVFLTDGVATASNGNWFGPSEPTSHNQHTQAAYNAGISLYNAVNGNLFNIGLFGAYENETDTLNIARDTLMRAVDNQSDKYFETFSGTDLSGIYESISQNLNYAAQDAWVKDIMSQQVKDHFDVIEESITTTKGTATYNSAAHEIDWNIGTIRDETINLSYLIKAHKDYPENWVYNMPTNTSANLSYKDTQGHNQQKLFPIPQINVPPTMQLTIMKVLEGGSSNQEFEININGPDGLIFNHFAQGGSTITYKGIPCGTYSADESFVPIGYELVSISGPVTLSTDNPHKTIIVTNKKQSIPWFHDEEEKDNIFTVGVIASRIESLSMKKLDAIKEEDLSIDPIAVMKEEE